MNFDEKDEMFFKCGENTLGKEEIACYDQFLLSPQCFQTTFAEDTYKPGFVWKGVNTCADSTNPFQPL